MESIYKKIVVKVGSNVLTNLDGGIDKNTIEKIVTQIVALKKLNINVVLISSGAVATGRQFLKLPEKTDQITSRQVLAAIGQAKLMSIYDQFFTTQNVVSAQVLVTKDDFRDRDHLLNIQNCFSGFEQNNIVPIINENDVISVTELMFTDNDELAGLVTGLTNADALIILSNIDGVYDGDPSLDSSQLIKQIDAETGDISNFVSTQKSNFGRGGMLTKSNIAKQVAKKGTPVFIANGKEEDVLYKIISGQNPGTMFVSNQKKSSTKKKLAFSQGLEVGTIIINQGAKDALLSSKATSILPIGVVNVLGNFQKGDIVKIEDHNNHFIGLGKIQISSDKLNEIKGFKNQKECIHYDYLFLNS